MPLVDIQCVCECSFTERGETQAEPNFDQTAVGESKEVGGNSSKDDAKSLLEELACDEDDEFVNDVNEEDEEERVVGRNFISLLPRVTWVNIAFSPI